TVRTPASSQRTPAGWTGASATSTIHSPGTYGSAAVRRTGAGELTGCTSAGNGAALGAAGGEALRSRTETATEPSYSGAGSPPGPPSPGSSPPPWSSPPPGSPGSWPGSPVSLSSPGPWPSSPDSPSPGCAPPSPGSPACWSAGVNGMSTAMVSVVPTATRTVVDSYPGAATVTVTAAPSGTATLKENRPSSSVVALASPARTTASATGGPPTTPW